MANNTPTPYMCWVFHQEKTRHPIRYDFVKSVFWLHKTLEKIEFKYHYINIYNRKTGVFISRQYFDVRIIDKPLL